MALSSMRIGFALTPSDPFWVQVREAGIQRAEQLGVVLVQVPQIDIRAHEEPVGLLEDLQAHEVRALIAPALSQSQMLYILEAGISWICSDEISLRHPKLVSPQGLYDAAALATHYLAKRLSGQGKILFVGGPELQQYTVRIRMNGFKDAIAQYPDLHYGRIPTLWPYDAAFEQLMDAQEHWCSANGGAPVAAILGISDPIALAARDAGRRLGYVDDHTLIAGVNGDPLAIAAILEGTMHATAATSAQDFGQRVVEFGLLAAQGESLPDTFPFSIELVTTKNVAQIAARKLADIAVLPDRLVDVNKQQEMLRLRHMETAIELNRHIGAILDEEELLRTLTAVIRERYAFDEVQFLFWSDRTRSFLPAATASNHNHELALELTDAGVLGYALLRNQMVYIPDTLNSPRFPPDPRWPGMRARVVLPTRVGGRTIGILDLHSRDRTVRSLVELDSLQTFADQVGVAMRNAQRYAEVLATTDNAIRANQMKSRLLAATGNELQRSLNAIAGFAHAALEAPVTRAAGANTEPDGMLRAIAHEATRLSGRLGELTELQTADAGELPFHPETLDTTTFLAGVFANATRLWPGERGVQWRLQLPAALPAIWADPLRLRTALQNLLDNAAVHTKHGQILLGATATGTELEIIIQDSGNGISTSLLAKVREACEAGVAVETTGPSGAPQLGFGIPIAHRIVVLHLGMLQIDSEPGHGVTCVIVLPIHRTASTVAPIVEVAAVGPGTGPDRGNAALVQKVHEFVAENYVTSFTREELADALGVSETYVSRVFRRATGAALWDFIHDYRIARACELLGHTTMTVTEIALAVGFNDPAYFTRVFRKQMGQSPQSYRKHAQPVSQLLNK